MNQIIDNLTSATNHHHWIQGWLSLANEAILVSPFMMEDLSRLLSPVACSKLERIRVVTTLKPRSREQIRKICALKSLVDSVGEDRVTVMIDNNLHGKVYIFKQAGVPIAGIITSANLTDAGLNRNHEWVSRLLSAKLWRRSSMT